MKRAPGHLIRFIDLGLLLLMAFLALSELNPIYQVALPGREKNSVPTVPVIHYRLVFDEDLQMRVMRLPDGTLLCQPHTPITLADCMSEHDGGRILITPAGKATVQQLVLVLDVCEDLGLACAAWAE